ncbi:SagB family peptide dehydrogenase [Archangium gephyra]|uniref:SagB family peptide dehydrogenase n=1 Tax=Archangium gephyra TaxID=48 RepID=UPI003B780365
MSLPEPLIHLHLAQGVSLLETGQGPPRLRAPWGDLALNEKAPGLCAALRLLSGAGAPENRLTATVSEREGPEALARLHFHLGRLQQRGFLAYTARTAKAPLATWTPGSRAPLQLPRLSSGSPHVLSRFAYLRREESRFVLESALSDERVVFHDWRARLLCLELSEAMAPSRLPLEPCRLSRAEALGVCTLLLGAGMLVGTDAEADGGAESWEFHELLFHARSRMGRHGRDKGFGATYHRGPHAPLPAVKPPMTDEHRPLPVPDLERLRAEDPPLAEVMERRRSIRTHGSIPLTEAQLGEFLYRTARVRSTVDSPRGQFSSRPYPGAGGCYELELYLSISTCQGLEPGLYHYDPGAHRLVRLSGMTAEVERLLQQATLDPGATPPQVLITLAARFQRMFWKYESMAYALILKDVGVLYQSMSLAAAAMGLAACALGHGSPDAFAEATGLERHSEASVGELILGSAPEE